MGSPIGSSEIGNCTCHVGHMWGTNESTCLVCPEGSWCDINGQHSCPSGTTSNPAGQSHEDCYCLDDYTGDLNCTARINTTNHRCDPGYIYDGPRWDSSKGLYYDSCSGCLKSYWCDGVDHFDCPTWTIGSAVIHNYAAKSFDDCFCPLGYISDNGQETNKCIACPEGKWCDRDGEHNISTTVTSAAETPATVTSSTETPAPVTSAAETSPTTTPTETTPGPSESTDIVLIAGLAAGGFILTVVVGIVIWKNGLCTRISISPHFSFGTDESDSLLNNQMLANVRIVL
jgi:hypothetical protein